MSEDKFHNSLSGSYCNIYEEVQISVLCDFNINLNLVMRCFCVNICKYVILYKCNLHIT
jgi:hypothetical protein